MPRISASSKLLTLMIATLLMTVSAGAVQGQAKTTPKSTQSRPPASAGAKTNSAKSGTDADMAWLQDALKNPALMSAVEHLSDRLTKEIEYPALRKQSNLMARLPEDTVFYAALPNTGAQVRQSLEIFRQELHDSAPMRDFLAKNHLEASEPKFEDGVAKFAELLDYLGDELVITGGLRDKEPSGVLIAEVRKPGLRAFLEKMDLELSGKSADHIHFFDPQQLETAADGKSEGLVVLIRPDFVLVSTSTSTLREYNTQLDKGSNSFASSALGKRIGQSYQAGMSAAVGVDIQKLFPLIPKNQAQTMAILEKIGLADTKFGVIEARLSKGHYDTQMELAFNGPRRGVASWIAKPGSLGALDFVSPKSTIAEVFRLKSPAQILDDIVEIAGPQGLAMLPQMEAQLKVNLKQDILSKLTGELGFEMEMPPINPNGSAQSKAVPQPNFTIILGVSDPEALQQTLKRLMTQAAMRSEEYQEDGVTIHSLSSTPGSPMAANYFFMDGYMVIATNQALARQAVRIHRGGGSLARSAQTSGAGQPIKASAFVYQNMDSFMAALTKELPPDTGSELSKLLSAATGKPRTFVVYADETTIRGTASGSGSDSSIGLIAAAIAIPNLIRAKASANEAAAMATVRTINTAEVTYMTVYPKKGYAATLAVMGPGATSDCTESNVNPSHACLLDQTVGNTSCIAGKWCEKNSYRYSVRGVCLQTSCNGYVVTATPVNESAGTRSFCSVKDAIVRSHTGAVTAPLTPAECRAWEPVN